MKNSLLRIIIFAWIIFPFHSNLYAQCNTNTSICTPGTAGPFGFVNPGTAVSTCLDWFGPNTGYILLNITSSGPLNMLINGNATAGFLDVAVFNIPNGVAPCTAIQNNANQIGCNYASASSGCNQFGTSFPCASSVPAPMVSAGQTLMIVVENWSGSSSTFTMQLGPTGAQTGPPNPAINAAGPFCSTQGNTQLTAVNQGGTWSGPGVSSSGMFNPSVAGPGIHTINYSIGVAPCNSQSSTQITVNAPGNVNVNPTSATICPGGSTVINASGASNYTWSPATGLSSTSGATVTASPANTTTYTVNASPSGCMTPASVTVTVSPLPNANAGAAQTITCSNPSVVLNGSSSTPGTTFSWSGPGIVSGGNTANPTVNVAGTYTLTVTSPTGCQQTSTVNVSQNNTLPNANAGTNQTIPCGGSSATLNGSSSTAGATFSWSGPGIVSGSNTATPSVNVAGLYTLTVTNPANGCTNTATVNAIDNSAIPNVNAGANQTLTCSNTSTTLSGSSSTGGATFQWSGPGIVSGDNTANPTVNAVGTYTLTVTDPNSGCTNSGTTNVTLNNTPPNANAGNAQPLTCTQLNTTLNGSSSTPGATFSWSGPGIVSGGNTANPTVNSQGTYTLTTMNPSNGCTATATVNVTVNNTLPNANAGAPQQLTCTQLTTVLYGSSTTPGATFSWSGPGIVSGGNTSNPVVDATGTYTLTTTNPVNGCTNTSTTTVSSNGSAPNAEAGNPVTITCAQPSVNLTGSSTTVGATYSWSGPGIVSGASTATPLVNQYGLYYVTITDPANGCQSVDSVDVLNNTTVPPLQIAADPLFGCAPLQVQLYQTSITSPAYLYSWSFSDGGSANGPSVQHNFNSPGCFDVNVTALDPANGCSNTLNFPNFICVSTVPNADFSFSPETIDPADPEINFNNLSQNATDYLWDFGDATTSTESDPTHTYLNASESFTVTLEASNGYCTSTIQKTIKLVEPILFYVPNTFTPDGDNYNQIFQPIITSGIDVQQFTFIIYNRWGEMIWESHDASVGWDGNYGGTPVQEGVYTWTMKFKDKRVDKNYEYNGTVNLMR